MPGRGLLDAQRRDTSCRGPRIRVRRKRDHEPDPALAARGVRSVFLRGHSGSQLYLRGSEISRIDATPCSNEFL